MTYSQAEIYYTMHTGYMLHNATDAIGNKVPTASQVTLDQIAAYQSRTAQKVDQIEARLSRMEDLLQKMA
jgi:hypothetical protein